MDYRCSKCHNCQACREAHNTERVSLREEAEELEIRDFENKRFLCSLPLRGKPEEYLSTNKRDAVKVLARQAHLYHKEEDTRNLILKAMDKLFSNGPLSLLKDLPQDP